MKTTTQPIFSRPPSTRLLLLAGALLMSPAQAEDVYKWVNQDNEVQYTQMPPPHGITAIRIQSAPPPGTNNPYKIPDPDQADSEYGTGGSSANDASDGEDSTDRDAEVARSMKENCNNARQNLASLQRGGLARFINPDGEVIRLSEEGRQQRIDEANSQIKLLCKG